MLKPKILFHRYTPWKGHIRCSTNIYAEKAIALGHDVFYFEKLVHPFRVIKGVFPTKKGYKSKALFCRPFTIVPFIKNGFFSKSIFASLTYRFISPYYKSVIRNFKPDIIWTVPPGSSSLKNTYPKAKLVMQVVDYYPAFLGDKIKKVEKKDYEAADHIFTIGASITKYLVEDLRISKSKITTLGQGVDFDHFQKKHKKPTEIEQLKGEIFVYVGLLSKLDQEYISYIVSVLEEQNASLFCIGPNAPDWLLKFSTNERVIISNSKPSNEIPAYLQYADYGLMLYDQNKQDIYKGQHPLKLYEYAACGLKIISTPHDEFLTLKPPCNIVNSKKDLKHLIENSNSFKHSKNQVIEFAKKYSWESIFLKALKKLINSDEKNNNIW